ncbi:MAG TPA: hypothetical protein PLO51_03425 [Candidatus Micrarchaeota archaeon]|nr:hypothetical protein [Candidatus Micrarchaeota archaeon]
MADPVALSMISHSGILPLLQSNPGLVAMNALHSSMTSWEPIIILATFATFLMVTGLYMFAFMFNLQSLKQWCKSEFAQVFVTFLIAIFLIALVAVGMNAAMSFTGTVVSQVGGLPVASAANLWPFDIAKAYVNATLDCSTSIYRWIYHVNGFVEFSESINMDVGGIEPAQAWHLSGLVGMFHITENRLTYVMFIQYGFYRLLEFFEATMFTFFLPVGLILRTFPLTRGVGGFMIALAIGGYIVFPLSFVTIVALQGNATSACTVNFATLPGVQTCGDSLSDAYMTQDYVRQNMSTISAYAQEAANKVAVIYLQAIFYPLVAMIIFFTFVRQTSSLMGADLAELVKII